MKTLRFLGMVLLTIVMSVNLSSCGDDDKEEDLPSVPDNKPIKKKLVSSILAGEGNSLENYSFFYDEESKMKGMSITRSHHDVNYIEEYSISDVNNKILYSCRETSSKGKITYEENANFDFDAEGRVNSGQILYTASYDENNIRSGKRNLKYFYDRKGFLNKVQIDEGEGNEMLSDNEIFIWSENNIVSVLFSDGFNSTITYGNIANNANIDLNWFLLDRYSDSVINNGGTLLMGLLNKHGIKCNTMMNFHTGFDITYELDEDGYIKKIYADDKEYGDHDVLTISYL